MRLIILPILFLSICSCRNYYVVRNYEHAPDANCDCFVYGGGISVGSNYTYKYKRKAKCNKLNHLELKELLNSAEVIKDSLNDEYWPEYPDSIKLKIEHNENLLDSIQEQWVKCKIKLKYKEIYLYRQLAQTIVKKKIKYYNIKTFGYRKIGKTVFLNDSIVKTSMEDKKNIY